VSFEETRIPTHLWVEGKLRELSAQGIGVYVTHKGEKMDGLVLLKLSNMQGQSRLLTQQRDIDGVMGWINVFDDDVIDESRADDYIARAKDRDPDQWVIEIEGSDMVNPFKD